MKPIYFALALMLGIISAGAIKATSAQAMPMAGYAAQPAAPDANQSIEKAYYRGGYYRPRAYYAPRYYRPYRYYRPRPYYRPYYRPHYYRGW